MDPETNRNELDGMEKQKQLKIVKERIKGLDKRTGRK